METVISIMLGVGVVASAVAIVILVRVNAAVTPSLVAYGKTTVDCIRNQAIAETQRDDYKARAIKAEAELKLSNDNLAAITERLNRILEEKAHAVVEEIRTAPTATRALDVFNRVLQDVPNVSSTKSASPSRGNGDRPAEKSSLLITDLA